MKRSFDFLGVEASGKGADRALVIPVPVEWSTSYGKGTAAAPDAILKASLQIELFNSSLGVDLEGSGIVTLKPDISGKESLVRFIREHRALLLDAFPCFIGGEHSITPWILEGFGFTDIGIVWIDAHADLRGSYLGERESHACAARNALDYGPIVEIGVRSYSKEESDFLNDCDRVKVFGEWNREARTAVEKLPDRVYLSLDFDAVDPSLLRAVGTPEPGGLKWDCLMDMLTFIFDFKNVVAMDAVELCPTDHDETSNFTGAKIIYEALSRAILKEVHG